MTLRKILLTTAVLALAAAPSALAAPNENANQRAFVKVCQNQKAQMGARNFNALNAPATQNPRAAMRNCARREAAATAQDRVNAARTCNTWRSDEAAFAAAMAGTPNAGKTFAQVFGNGANAHGKCVSTVARANAQARREARVSAARTCATWRDDPAAFAAAMAGTANAGKTFAQVFGTSRSAYGKCVSQQARAAS